MAMSTKGVSPEEKRPGGEPKRFWAFFKRAKLSWGWIAAATVVTMVYYLTVSRLPGSTSALFMGKFTKSAIMGVVENYSLTLLCLVGVSVVTILAEAKSVRSIRQTVWARMMGIQSAYYNRHGANTLLSAVTSDTEITVSTLMGIITGIPGMITYLISAMTALSGFSPKLLWSVFVLIPVYVVYALLMGRWQYRVGHRIQSRIGGLTGYLTDRIRNLTTIKAYVTEAQEEMRGFDVSSGLYHSNIEYAKLNSVVVAYTIGTEVIATVTAVIWGCVLLRRGEIDLQAWLAFFLFMPTINTVLRRFSLMWSNFREVQGRAVRLSEIMDAPQEDASAQAEAPGDGPIALEHVNFAYIEGVQSLRDVSFTIQRGKTTAIVGHSGSGKTTILRLLERLYAPDSGRITVGGQDLQTVDLRAWRGNISYVTQGAELFSGTIRDCLTYGVNREVTDDELNRVCQIAGIDAFIARQPHGYDEPLAIWGSSMSGGQRQRMVIARELLKDADILILDEPTSALDAETASAISDLFFHQFRGKTIIAVTHELGFITHADCIVVMEDGAVTGRGTHGALMAGNSAYRELVEQQSYQEVFEG